MKRGLIQMFAAVFLFVSAAAASAQSLVEVTGFGSNPGNLRMFRYVPANLPAGSPLVVVAHGCGQTAQQMATTSGWLTLADRHKIALVFPQTSTQNEPQGGCFRTWQAAHHTRGAGEALSVRQMITRMRTLYPAISAARIHMTGMSSGGHLTNVMLATYPEVFASGAPQSSFPYKCATTFAQVALCASGGRQNTHTAQMWGNLARSGYPGYTGPRPKVLIWHGGSDPLMYLSNQYMQVMQWTNAHGIDATADWVDYVLGRPRISYRTGAGETRVQTITVQGMGHAVAVDPGSGSKQCGAIGPYAVDVNICAAHWTAAFFGIAP